jgi:choline-sulfatase
MSKTKLTLATVAIVLAAAAGGFYWQTRPSRVGASALNLLVVTLDTTRADRIGAYGLADAGTPVLDRLAREGALFTHATSSAPLTLPSHASLFTGRFPPRHGVRDNGGFFLDEKEETLAESVSASGFKTGAFVAAYVLDSKWGVNQGFSHYFDDFDLSKYRAISLGAIQRPGNEVVDRALEWLQGFGDNRSRFFAWVHLYDPHTPYEAPEPYKSSFASRPYQAEIAFADSQVGRLMAYLEERQLLDRTVVVVAGDHGESLGDHGEQAHGFFVYESVTRVPLIVRAPFDSMKGRRIEDPVRLVDVLPTVLALVGVTAPANDTIDGRSLVPLLTGATREMGLEAYAEALYPLHHFGWSDLRALREGRFKLIAAPRPELYDLADDPQESTNLFESRRALGERMLGRLNEMESEWARTGSRPKEAVEVDPEAKARLAALGYVGSFVMSADSARRGELADPKDKVHLFNMISHARDLTKQENAFDEIVGTLRKVLQEDAKVIDAWFMLGNVHAARGKHADAIGFFKRALELKPDDEMAVINMANAYRNLGRDEEALVGYQRFLQLDPRNAQVRYEAAQILIDRAKYDEAAAQLRQTLDLEPKLAAARNALGVIAIRRGDLAGAEREIRAAIEQKPDVRLAHFNLALIAEQRGQAQLAITEYQKELSAHPNAFKAAFNLGRLYEQLGDKAAQEASFRQAIEINPNFVEGHFYLAKLYLDQNREFDRAIALAKRGLEIGPASEYAPLGHYVLADIYSRRGMMEESRREAERGRARERGREGARKSVLD